MKALPDIVANIELAPSSHGGRASPMPARWFGCVMVVDSRNYDVRLRLAQPLQAGESRRVGIDFLDPNTALAHIRMGTTFGLWEGRIVGQGAVEAVGLDSVVAQ